MKHQKIRKTILFLMFFMVPILMNVFSPVVIIFSSMEGILSFTFYAWTIMFISSFFVGRAFCAYICPYGGLQTTVYEVGKKELVKIKHLRWLRYFMGAVWLGMIVYLYIRAGAYKSEFWYMMENKVSIDDIYGVYRYYMIIGGALLFILLLGRRSFCKYLCPMSILNTIGNYIKNKLKIPSLRLVQNEGCIDCMKCSKVCEMSLDVHQMVITNKMDNNDCILCGECVQACPKKVLSRVVK